MRDSVRLVVPCEDYRESYGRCVDEFVERGEKLVPFTLAFPREPFPVFLEKLAACARGEGIPPGFVPHSTLWLVEGHEVVGVSNLRHRLTEALRRDGGNIGYGIRPSRRGQGFGSLVLRHTLEVARGMGIEEAWLTCAKDNIASARAILRNGGAFVSEEYLEPRGQIVQRYRIALE
jgi:predicted acetyltransferase